MDKPAYYNDLFQQYLTGNISPEHKKELYEYMASQEATKHILAQLRVGFDSWETLPNHISPEQGNRIKEAILMQSKGSKLIKLSPKSWYYTIAAAVVLFLISTTALVLYKSDFGLFSQAKIVAAKDETIIPGSTKALLTLSDGSIISLNDSTAPDVALQAGIIIEKLSTGEIVYKAAVDSAAYTKTTTSVYNTIQTPRGGQCRLVLPDGSQVWLNSASSISFPQFFYGLERKVIVNGEAYFEVAHNKAMPFKVTTGPQTVEVLGTHFSINSSKDLAIIKTTLFEGSVLLSNGKNSRILKPGQQSKLVSGNSSFSITDMSVAKSEPDWTEGYFSFDNTDFTTIQEQLEKWYDVTFEYDKIPENRFFGKIQRSAPIEEVLKMMEIVSKNIHFKIQGRKIYVIQNLP